MTIAAATINRDGAASDAATPIQAFLEERTKAAWRQDEDLFASGLVSSLFAMQLVVFLEKTFDVTISGTDLRLENFRSVERMLELVRRLGPARAGADGD